jgi:hypothetical protein
MRTQFVYLSPAEVPALPDGFQLMLNAEERIVTLLGPERIYAQCRFSKGAFRLLFLLLRAPHGANYAELLACLRCSEAVFRRLLTTVSHEDVLTLLAPQINRWNKHLEQSALQGNSVLERELKMVRRAAKEHYGVDTILKKHGFALTVKAMYRKGYLLTPTVVPRVAH